MKKLILLFPLLLCSAIGQRLVSLEGEVNPSWDDLTIELVNGTTHFVTARTTPSRDGHFEFRGVEEAYYQLRVSNRRGDILYVDHVSAHAFSPHVSIRLHTEAKPARPVSGFVSVKQLSHEASKSFKKAVRHLQTATAMVEAKDFSGARNELLKAIEIDPTIPRAYINLAIVDMLRGDPVGAEQCASRALELEPKSQHAAYLVTYARFAQGSGPRPIPPANSYAR